MTALDCAGVWACQGFESMAVSSCAPACDGDVLVECEGGTVRYRTDCTRTSQTCVVGANGPACGLGPCTEAAQRCDGNVLVSCDAEEGIESLTFCDQFGWTCEESGSNLARCSDGTSVACTPGVEPRCEGTTLVRCVDRFELGVDCASLVEGMGCFLLGTHSYCGFGDACDPDLSKGMETCEGTVMSYCAAGLRETLDCADYGFVMCSASATFGGRCTNTL